VHVVAVDNVLTQEQLDELSRWAKGLLAGGASGDLRSFALTIVPLVAEAERLRKLPGGDGSVPAETLDGLELVRERAEAVMQNGAPDHVQAAARAVLMLCADIARFEPLPVPAAPARPHNRRRIVVLAVGGTAAAALLVVLFMRGGGGGLDAQGPSSTLIGAAALSELVFSVPGDADDENVQWRVDGNDVRSGVAAADGRVVFRPSRLADGKHTVEVSRPGGLWGDRKTSWTFTIDTAAPTIRVTKGSVQVPAGGAYELRGQVEPGVALRVNGAKVAVDEQGRFAVPFRGTPTRAVILLARDGAGNSTDSRLVVHEAPRLPSNPVRAVHVSAEGWANADLRNGVLALLAQRRINAVELDLKDESGIVGWASGVPLARRIGAEQNIYDLRAAASLLHARGARVIGRLVAFRDPVLSQWAWSRGKHELVIQTPEGGAYSGGYGGFTNFASPQVQKYNVDIAGAAARAGVDDVLYDYVRRPDGPMESMVVPGLEGDPSAVIAGFLKRAHDRLAKTGAFLGASVFGISATRPDEIAQNVPAIARHVDYVAPMLYPSHWGPYEYGLANPSLEPHEIVRRSLRDFETAVKGTTARVVPWLQDFSLAVPYGRKRVKAQIDGARAAGIHEFLLWDPNVTYTGAALRHTARVPTVGTRASAPDGAQLVTLPASRSPNAPVRSGLAPNELGSVPVVMYHQVVPGGGSEYDLTPEEFRAELDRLYREHYRPVTASAYVTGHMNVPRGATPVVLTFDDSSASQARLLPGGGFDPDSAVGIMLEFAREHPDFRPAGTFYVNRDPFGGDASAAELVRKLEALGFELGNHTLDHARLDQLDDEGVQREIVLDSRLIRELAPGAKIVTMALPYGIAPTSPGLAREGQWDGEKYAFKGVFLTGAEPAPSPFSSSLDPDAIPRVRTDPGTLENGSSDWLRRLADDPDARYVSDGNARKVTFPGSEIDRLAPAYRPLARPTG
jgi:hypothetical protein